MKNGNIVCMALFYTSSLLYQVYKYEHMCKSRKLQTVKKCLNVLLQGRARLREATGLLGNSIESQILHIVLSFN